MPVTTTNAPIIACVFCGAEKHRTLLRGGYHNRHHDFGPFDILCCDVCGSWATQPIPSAADLRRLYAGYQDGLPEDLVCARRDSSQTAWYRQCAQHVAGFAQKTRDSKFRWLEVAPGAGEFCALFAEMFPNSLGTALDLHARPEALTHAENVEWRQADVNTDFPRDFHGQFDVVASISVFEHVQNPQKFLTELLSCVSPGGVLYIVCPDAGSMMARLLGRNWPYTLPGEHLFMSTLQGSRVLIDRTLRDINIQATDVAVRAVSVPYTLRYLAAYARITRFCQWIPADWSLPIPAGAQEIMIRIAAR